MSDLPRSARAEPFTVSFLCTGNRARSALAEAFFRRNVDRSDVIVSSRGTQRLAGLPALPHAIEAGRLYGLDLTRHRSTPLARGELSDVDLTIGFEGFHVAAAVVDGGAPKERVFTIRELAALLELVDADHGEARRTTDSARSRILAASELRGATSMLVAPELDDPLGKRRNAYARVAEQIATLTDIITTDLFQRRATSWPSDDTVSR